MGALTYFCRDKFIIMLKFLGTFLLLNGFLNLYGQKQFVFTHYESRTGLPSNQINSIIQDKKGYIWMGSLGGLISFDGIRFKSFRAKPDDTLSIPMRTINQTILDYKNRLWIVGGQYKVGIFDTEQHVFKEARLQLRDSTLKNAPKGIVKGIDDAVLLGVGGRELLVLDEKDYVFKPADDYFPIQPGWDIHSFGVIPNTHKFWAVINNQLIVYNRDSKNVSTFENNIENELIVAKLNHIPHINNLHFDQKNRLWLSAWSKDAPRIYCLDLQSGEFALEYFSFFPVLKTYHEIRDFAEQSDGTIWISGLGVFAYYDESKKCFEHIHSGTKPYEEINYEVTLVLFEDREHNIWVGTDGAGLYRFNPKRNIFSNVYMFRKSGDRNTNGSPQSFFMDTDSSMLVGVWGNGIYRFNLDLKHIPIHIKGLPEDNGISVWDMCHDRDSVHAWFATQKGIFKLNKVKRSGQFLYPAIFQNRTVRQVEADAYGNMWFGTQGLGLIKWDAQKGKYDFEKGLYPIKDAKINRPINKIIVDSKGWVWVSCEQAGIYVLDASSDKIIYHFRENASGFENLPTSAVCGLLEYNDSLMILTTNSHVLCFNRKEKKTTVLYGPEDISGFIASLEKDNHGHVWMGTTTTLYRFQPDKKGLWAMDRRDGIFNDAFVLSASLLMPDGRLAFGVSEHFIAFDPAKIESSAQLPPVSITAARVNNQNYPLNVLLSQPSKTVLTHEQNALTIDLATFVFNVRCTIQYRLEGIDKNWVNADNNGQADYAFLPPGTYRFYTRTADADMNFSEEQHQFTLQILPPFYQAWWFYSLLILAAGGLLFWLDHERKKRESAVEQIRNDISDDLHKEVHTALQNINVLSEMANIKAETDPQKAKEFIAQIHGKSHQMIDAMEDMLWSITPENDSMYKMVERMKELTASLNARHPSKIELRVDEMILDLTLNMKQRYDAFVIFKKGLHKIAKACPDGFRIHIDAEGGTLNYTIDCPQTQSRPAPLKRDDFFQQKGVVKWLLFTSPSRS